MCLYKDNYFCKLCQLCSTSVNYILLERVKDDLIRFKEHADYMEPGGQLFFSQKLYVNNHQRGLEFK
jgi:hypothetical protein